MPINATYVRPAGELGRARALIVAGAIVAGLASFAIGEATAELVPADTVQFKFFAEKRERVSRNTVRVAMRTAALAFGSLGVCLGGYLGIAGGLARRSMPAAAIGGLLGAVPGGILGAVPPYGCYLFPCRCVRNFPTPTLLMASSRMSSSGARWEPWPVWHSPPGQASRGSSAGLPRRESRERHSARSRLI